MVELALAQEVSPTPTYDPLVEPPLPENPTEVELGRNLYWHWCMTCHGDQGQGLTNDWRAVWEEDHQNCWARGCHAGNNHEDIFVIPTIVPLIIGESHLAQFSSLLDLANYLQQTHPPQHPGILTNAEYHAIAVYVFSQNDRSLVRATPLPTLKPTMIATTTLPPTRTPALAVTVTPSPKPAAEEGKPAMELLTITLISISLAMDAFAVSLSIGTCGQITNLRGKIRLAAHFGIFQAGMTALGYLMGETIVIYVREIDHWIAFALLGYVGFNLIRSGFDQDGKAFHQDPSTGKVLVILSFATSIDAFAVGLSISILNVSVLLSVLMIGLVALILSGVGLLAGARLGEVFGKRMEILGGLILLGIGIRVIVSHLLQ